MRSKADHLRRTFTVDQANAALPLVRAIVGDLVALAREVVERRERLAVIGGGRGHQEPSDAYGEELAQVEAELDRDTERLQEYVGELLELGVEPKSATEGLVDFPALIDGRPAYLCWRLGEPEVLFWHELDAGFRGRQPLTAGSLSQEGGPSSADESDD
jgi:hypothetical protein